MPKRPVTPVTQAEVARKLGVHQTTVSGIFSGKLADRFSPELQKRVIDQAKKMGYRPSAPARALRGVQSGLVGIFPFGRAKDIESERLHEIVAAIHATGYQPLAMPMDTRIMCLQRDEISACNVMLDARVEGLILSGFADDFDLSQLERFRKAGIPIVSVSGIKLPRIPLFAADRNQAIYEMVSHLITQGYRKLAYLHRRSSQLTALTSVGESAAVKGFYRAAREHGIPKKNTAVFTKMSPMTLEASSSDAGYNAGEEAMKQLWESGARPHAVICYDDSWAVGVYSYCQRHGIHIPEDMAVAGFENQHFGNYLYPRLTSSAQPYREIASAAVHELTAVLQGGQKLQDAIRFFPCKIVVRESTCGPKKMSPKKSAK